jgi:Winged helix-turn-helix DNA-binding
MKGFYHMDKVPNRYFWPLLIGCAALVGFFCWAILPLSPVMKMIAFIVLLFLVSVVVLSIAGAITAHTVQETRVKNVYIQSEKAHAQLPQGTMRTTVKEEDAQKQPRAQNAQHFAHRRKGASQASSQPAQQSGGIGYRPPSQAVVTFTQREVAQLQKVQLGAIDKAILDAYMAAQQNGYELSQRDIAKSIGKPESTVRYHADKMRELVAQ